MKNTAIVYWSGTGNTAAMAEEIAKTIRGAECKADMLGPQDFSASMLNEYDAIIFGCPSMGAEQLEEEEVEPMFAGLESSLGGKKVALFGSYGWGNGEWMFDWEDRCKAAGATLVTDSVICNEYPDDDAFDRLRILANAVCKA